MKRLFCTFIPTLLLAGCETSPLPPDLTPALQEPTLTIAQMQALTDGNNVLTFSEEHLIGGVVTTSDASGNFYRSFLIEDYTGAVEVMAGSYDLHALYPVGRVVYIQLKGLTVARNALGIYQLGYPGTSARYAVGYIGGPSGLTDRHVMRAGMNYEFRIPEVTLSELALSGKALLGRLVTVRSLALSGGTTWGTPGAGGDTDVTATGAGGEIVVRTSDYADFADIPVPTANVSLTGILMKEKNVFLLKIRALNDISVSF